MKKTFKKRAFISAIAMLVVSAIVLTSATFAWFSMARTVDVEAMDLTVTSPEGVQISANTKNWTTTITAEDIIPLSTTTSRFKADADHTNHIPDLLSPASSRLSYSAGTLPVFFQGSFDNDGVIDLTQATDAAGGYVVFDVFLKVSEAQDIYWGKTTITSADNAEALDAMRIAVVDLGSDADPTTAKTVSKGISANDYAGMYEIDAADHLAALPSITGKIATRYIYSAPAAPLSKVTSPGSFTNGVISATQYAATTSATKVADEDSTSSLVIKAEAGINRMRVYVWVEGNDVDCLNDIAGSTLSLDLQFSLDA